MDLVYTTAIISLGLCKPLEWKQFIKEVGPIELGLLHKQKIKDDKEQAELFKMAVFAGVAMSNMGKKVKNIPLFEEKENLGYNPNAVSSVEEKQNILQDLFEELSSM